MQAPVRRAIAFGVDWVLANLIGGVLLLPVFYLASDPYRIAIVVTPALVGFSMILLAIVSHGNTPGKRWLQLHVTGSGCVVCREVRRLGWVLFLGVVGISDLLWTGAPSAIWAVIGLWLIFGFAVPLLRGAGEFPHNQATGFEVRWA